MLVCLAGSGAHLPRKRDVLSLTSYDVYHLRAELVAGCSGRVSAQLLEDAAARLDRFARRSRVSVGRVIAPPHNMSALPAHDALVGAGFEALCTKLGWREDWPQELASTAGIGAADVSPAGLPGLARHAFQIDSPAMMPSSPPTSTSPWCCADILKTSRMGAGSSNTRHRGYGA